MSEAMWAQATRLVDEASRLIGTSFSDLVPPDAQRHLLIAQRELLLALAAVIEHHTQQQDPEEATESPSRGRRRSRSGTGRSRRPSRVELE
jgi:hypothetical protein